MILMACLALAGCSRKQSTTIPIQITVVETAETKDQAQIEAEALGLLSTTNFAGLDALAAKYRDSKEAYADGSAKLVYVYDGLAVSDEDPEGMWIFRQKQIQGWMNACPESAAARIAMARFLCDYAWKARGGGYANTVTDEGWKLMGERLNQAAQTLRSARDLNGGGPVYWSSLLRVSLGLQVEKADYNSFFNEAVKEYPYYVPYYQVRATYLLPRWYGEEGEWQKDLTRSADQISGEGGDMIYAQTVWTMHHYGEGINVFEGQGISWDRVDRGFGGILKQFPDSIAAKNERANLAALAGDAAKAREYFQDMNGQVDLCQWSDTNEVTKAINWAFSH